MSRSTVAVAVAIVLGISSSNPDGWMLELIAIERFLVGGIDHPEQRLGRVGGHGQELYIVDQDELGADQLGDRLGDRVIGAVAANEDGEALERVPRDGAALVDREVPERFDDSSRFPEDRSRAATSV